MIFSVRSAALAVEVRQQLPKFCASFSRQSRRKTLQKFWQSDWAVQAANRKSIKKLSPYHIFGTKFAYKSKKHLLFADFSLKAKKDKNAYHKPTPKPPKLTKLPK
ncbi:MAG: hypothetical protein SO045_06445 [Campylobacter sp.]|nr:hypothetical protein [Campylobacter sp.]